MIVVSVILCFTIHRQGVVVVDGVTNLKFTQQQKHPAQVYMLRDIPSFLFLTLIFFLISSLFRFNWSLYLGTYQSTMEISILKLLIRLD